MADDDNPDLDPFFFELLLQDVPLVSLLSAANDMEGVVFLHPTQASPNRKHRFNFQLVKPAVETCIDWAENHGPEDVRAALGVEQLAAVRAWTATPLCYVLTDVLRSPERTRQSVLPVLPFARLLFTALHALPERFIFKPSEGEGGILYRAERGVTAWDAKMRPGGIFSFHVPTSCSLTPAVLTRFKDVSGDRTVYIVHGAAGWVLRELSAYDDEDEVLLEPVCHFQVCNQQHAPCRLCEENAICEEDAICEENPIVECTVLRNTLTTEATNR